MYTLILQVKRTIPETGENREYTRMLGESPVYQDKVEAMRFRNMRRAEWAKLPEYTIHVVELTIVTE